VLTPAQVVFLLDVDNTLLDNGRFAADLGARLEQGFGRRAGASAVLAHFAQAGIDVDALALQLQRDGAQAFVKSWKELLERIAGKSAALAGADKENA
jgi:hypothetical protein